MAQVRWTPQAADDLDAITEFIAQGSPAYAVLFVIDVLATVEHLVRFPRVGRVVPEIGDAAIRELILGNYRIIYRLQADVAEILTIHHGARLLDPSGWN